MKYVASSISQMTDYDKYYVYTGHEEGMITGCWYFWSGTEWLIGGDYQCGIDDIIETSSTMDEEGMPADAKAVGDMIVVSNTEPTSPHTELWIDPDTESVLVPTMDDIEGTYAKKSEVESTYARKAAVGSPLRAATAAAMTDVTKIYVYTGSETGYTSGHWYYYDGSSWADGGVYNSTAFVTDKTLTGDGEAADAKVTGDEVTDLKSALNYGKTATQGYILTASNEGHGSTWSPVGLPTDEQTGQAVSDWLDSHPEATTTVQDGSISRSKLTNDLKSEINFTNSIYNSGGYESTISKPQFSTYTGGRIEINEAIDLDNYDVGHQFKTISSCTFILNSDMFTWSLNNSKQLPTFVNCVFYGNNDHNIVSNGRYITTAKFVNCVFFNCAFVNNAKYIQAVRFIGCRFAGSLDIVSGLNCSDVVFDNCQGESDFTGHLLNIDASTSSNKNAVDLVELTNCLFEGNTVNPLVDVGYNTIIKMDGCYFEGYPNGIFKASNANSDSWININVAGCKSWQCGSPLFSVNSNYPAENIKIRFESCHLEASVSAELLNRYDAYEYSVENCYLHNITAERSVPNNIRNFTFSEVNGAITATVQLEPNRLYMLTQARVTYTGIIVYMVVVTGNDNSCTIQKIVDDNNRWTITDAGNASVNIVSGGWGVGKVIDLGYN